MCCPMHANQAGPIRCPPSCAVPVVVDAPIPSDLLINVDTSGTSDAGTGQAAGDMTIINGGTVIPAPVLSNGLKKKLQSAGGVSVFALLHGTAAGPAKGGTCTPLMAASYKVVAGF